MHSALFSPERAKPASDSGHTDVDLTRLSFLILDDQNYARRAISNILWQLGVTRIESVDNYDDALSKVNNSVRPFDVVLSDFALTGQKDGQQFLEELRRNRMIPTRTVFVMITGESGYREVISAAELLPDDYLIKPFTADMLQGRLTRAIQRKTALAAVLEAMDARNFPLAVRCAKESKARYPRYAMDLSRLEAEALMAAGHHGEVIDLCSQLLARRTLPWANLLKSKALLAMGQVNEAQTLATDLVMRSPEYLAAYDVQANVLSAAGNTSEAQRVLEQALHKNPKGLNRRRMHGKLAVRNGDSVAAEKSFSTLLQQGHNTGFLEADDYAQCALAAVRNGRAAYASEVMERACQAMPDNPTVRAQEAMIRVTGLDPKTPKHLADPHWEHLKNCLPNAELSPDLKLELMRSALRHGDIELGKQLGQELAFQQQGDEAALAEITKAFEAHELGDEGLEVLAKARREIIELNNRAVLLARDGKLRESVDALLAVATRPYAPVLVILNAVSAIVTLANQANAEPALLKQAKSLLDRAERLDLTNSKIERLRSQISHLTA